MSDIRKAVVLATDFDVTFLPLSKILPKELWPLVDKPLVQHLLEELKESGISQVVFVLSAEKKQIMSYFKKSKSLESLLKKDKKEKALLELKDIDDFQTGFSITSLLQEKPSGQGNALLQAKEKMGKEPFALLFCDDIISSNIPATLQLLNVFKTCQRPVVGLYRIDREKISSFPIVEVEKIAHRIFKVKKIMEKPLPQETDSDLAIIGKYILTQEIFDYLKAQKKKGKGEIRLIEALKNLLADGKVIYGYEIDGKRLECRDKIGWLRSQLWLSLRHSQLGVELKKYFKETI